MYMSKESLAFAIEVCKDISKEELISSRQYFQDEHVKLSNENYRLLQEIQKILNRLSKEIENLQDSEEDEDSIDGEEIYDNGRVQGKFEAFTSVKRMLENIK